ncbi:MAG: S9 family peptidase [bacterium]|nr:S9 family peptidase [bacterium]
MKQRHLICALVILLGLVSSLFSQTKTKEQSLLFKGSYIPDIGTFLQIGANSFSASSWDGSTVYFTSSASGASQIYRLTDRGWPYQLTMFEDGIDFFTLSWGGDMGIVGASVGGSEQSQLFLMDTETGRLVALTNSPTARYGSVAWANDDRSIYYNSTEENGKDFFIYKMDVTTGVAQKIFGDTTGGIRGYNWIADLSQDGSRMIISNLRSNVANDLYLVELGSGKYQKLNSDTGNVLYQTATMMPDNQTIYWLSNNNEEGISRVAKVKVGKGKPEFLEDGWIDSRWETTALGFSRDYRYMMALVNEDGYVRIRLREVETGQILSTPPLDGIVSGGGFDKNGNVVFSFNGPTRTTDVWRWNPKTGELTQLTFATYAGIDRELFSEPQLIHYTSFDGLEIPAFVYLPKSYKQGTPIPFVIEAHGGPEGQSQPYFTRNIQFLLLNGYGVMLPNVRGSEGYGREYLNLDNYKNRKHSLQDYKAAAEWLISKGYSAQGKLAIRGGSYGGYVVFGMITDYPDLFSAAIGSVGISNFVTFLQNTAAYRRGLREAEYGPLSDSAFLKEISPIHKAHLIKTPLLVIHGANDPRVPIGEARQIIEAVTKNGGIVDSMIFADEGHGAGKRSNIIPEYEKQMQFLNTYLKNTEMKPEEKAH